MTSVLLSHVKLINGGNLDPFRPIYEHWIADHEHDSDLIQGNRFVSPQPAARQSQEQLLKQSLNLENEINNIELAHNLNTIKGAGDGSYHSAITAPHKSIFLELLNNSTTLLGGNLLGNRNISVVNCYFIQHKFRFKYL